MKVKKTSLAILVGVMLFASTFAFVAFSQGIDAELDVAGPTHMFESSGYEVSLLQEIEEFTCAATPTGLPASCAPSGSTKCEEDLGPKKNKACMWRCTSQPGGGAEWRGAQCSGNMCNGSVCDKGGNRASAGVADAA